MAPERMCKPSLNEIVFPFRGNWNLSWVVQRYLRTATSGFRVSRLANALLAAAEMGSGRIRVRSKPCVLRIEPTNVCNLHCPRCSCGIDSDPRPKGFICLTDYSRILDDNRNNAIVIRLDGNGEPTLHPEIFEMIHMAKARGLAVSMSSNFNTRPCDDTETLLDSRLDRLVIAIDGSTQGLYERYRVGGELAQVERRIIALLKARAKRRSCKPFVEVQFLDWGYNRHEIPILRHRTREWGVDRFTVIAPDWAVDQTRANPDRPRRCFWLWCVLTVDWALHYRSCANAWTLPWPRMNLVDVSPYDFWKSNAMAEGRRYNLDKNSVAIASDSGCHCNNCSDMLVVNRPPAYVCE